MNARLVLVLGIFALHFIPAVAVAQDEALKALLRARSLKCEFQLGSVGKWSGVTVSIEKDMLDDKAKLDLAVHFDAIDLKAGKARLIGSQGAGDITVWGTASGISFIEQTGFGNLVFTTVFREQLPGTTAFYAVTSRHMLMFNKPPLPSQYYGSCKIWQ